MHLFLFLESLFFLALFCELVDPTSHLFFSLACISTSSHTEHTQQNTESLVIQIQLIIL